jgi:hypothetical protein
MTFILARVLASVITICLSGYILSITIANQTLLTGESAGRQFQNSDNAYIVVTSQISFLQVITSVPTLVGIFVLIMLWWQPFIQFIKERRG